MIALRKSLVERYFLFAERKPSDMLLWHILLFTVILSGAMLLINASRSESVTIPARGGTLQEGVIGSPRFVNPVLAITRADQDMAALIYSGLLKLNANGELQPDIAKSMTVSDDGLIYNIALRDDVRFHDGQILDADDVMFTIGLIQDPNLKSPLRGNFDGVVVEKLGDFEINFVLEEAYSPFIENLTVGILPKHEWVNLTVDQIPFSQHNSHPIGSGPYEVASVARNTSGLINGYTLKIANTYPTRPMIETLELYFYPNEVSLANALKEGVINSASGLTDTLQEVQAARPDLVTYEVTLPRTFGLFYNQNKSAVLRQKEVRAALDKAIDRGALVEEIFNGNASPIYGPIPAAFSPSTASTSDATSTTIASTTPSILDEARTILTDAGWKVNEDGHWSKEIDDIETILAVDIATANLPFLGNTAEHIRAQWETLGVVVSVRQFEQSDLTQAVIRTRDYEALLFGTALGRSLDFYPFWHSSQRNDPGLNVALYANITVDAALTTARVSTDENKRTAALEEFLTELAADNPATFLFSPTLATVMPKRVIMEPITKLTAPHERYANIEDWHIATESVWPIFTK